MSLHYDHVSFLRLQETVRQFDVLLKFGLRLRRPVFHNGVGYHCGADDGRVVHLEAWLLLVWVVHQDIGDVHCERVSVRGGCVNARYFKTVTHLAVDGFFRHAIDPVDFNAVRYLLVRSAARRRQHFLCRERDLSASLSRLQPVFACFHYPFRHQL